MGTKYWVPLDEQETTVQFSRIGDAATIWTSDATVMTKLDKLVGKSSQWTLKEEKHPSGSDNVVAKRYETNKKLITFRANNTAKRKLTEEQRAECAERLRKNLAAKC